MPFIRLRTIITLIAVVFVLAPVYNQYHEQIGLPPLAELPAWAKERLAPAPGAAAQTAVDRTAARAQLGRLAVRPAGSMSGYSRDAFRHWSDPDGNGCDARDDTLRRDGRKLRPARGCEIRTGVWRDPYGGTTFRVPGDLDIDHMVPLANAWRSGAARWSDGRREEFANDPRNLLAVSASLNRQKGDKGPEAWKPPLAGYRAAYAARWIAVKAKYGLSVNPAEKRALAAMLG